MDVYFTSVFASSVLRLCERPKHGYTSLRADIVAYINKTLSQNNPADLPTLLYREGPVQLKKTRIPNSGQKIGASGGFRLIWLYHLEKEQVTFLEIYPKKGHFSKDDLTDKEELNLVNIYLKEADSLEKLSIGRDTFEIPLDSSSQ